MSEYQIAFFERIMGSLERLLIREINDCEMCHSKAIPPVCISNDPTDCVINNPGSVNVGLLNTGSS